MREPMQRLVGHCRLALVLIFIFISGASARAQIIKDPLPLLERPWVEAVVDPQVLGLFALDQDETVKSQKAMKQLDDDPLKADAPAAPSALATLDGKADAHAAGPGAVIDTSLAQRPGRLLGATQWSRSGRFGGALRLDGKGGMATPSYPEAMRGQAFTIGAWFMPGRGDSADRTLFCMLDNMGGKPLYELRRRSAEQLVMIGDGRELAVIAAPMPEEKWTHVAIIPSLPREFQGARPWEFVKLPHHVMVVVNGKTVATVDHEALSSLLPRSSGQVQLGFSTDNSPGFVGLIDQVHACKGLRGFYAWRLDELVTSENKPIADGQPYLRDKADLASSYALEDAVALAPTKAKPPTTMPGVRGAGVMVGMGHMPIALPLREPIDPSRGSIELWFSPHDWDNRTEQEVNKPLLVVPLIDIASRASLEAAPAHVATLTLMAMTPVAAQAPPIRPGAWHHLVITWRGNERAVFLNGKSAIGPFVNLDFARPPTSAPAANPPPIQTMTLGRTAREGTYFGNATQVDEVRIYRRPLTPPEAANAFARYLPKPELQPLPFAHVDLALNAVTRRAGTVIDMLDSRRADVAAIDFALFGPAGDRPIKTMRLDAFSDGRVTGELTDLTLEYGTQRGEFTFLDNSGAVMHKAAVERQRIKPAWLDNTLGLHDGKVLPGWDPMAVNQGVICLSCRQIKINGGGFIESLVASDQDILAAPMSVRIKDATGSVVPRAASTQPNIEIQRPDLIKTRGQLVAGVWKIDTAITTEFDGLMKVEMTLSPQAPTDLDELVVEIPIRNQNATFYGLWGGNSWFRGSCDYRMIPDKPGAVLESKTPGVSTHPGMTGSFIPFVAITDDQRGLHWFAENDEHWTKSKDVSAVQVQRDEKATTLRLNIITQRTRIDGPRTFVFGLQATPVKALAANRRTQARLSNFGWVDGFSKQELKADRGNHMTMMIWPEGEDWDAAAKRGRVHRGHYQQEPGYHGPFLYIDRLWVRTPPNAEEHAAVWKRAGFFRHIRAASDCHAWYMNEWLRRKIIAGIYIDDMWIVPSGDPSTGLAYRLPDGKAQPGYEFFDHHAHMKRLRWLFHDNGVEPYLWVHATNTLYVPALSFVDVFLEGEDRFPNWGEEADFIHKWGLPRLRFTNPEKWGIATTWMMKLGNDRFRPPGMGHWEYRQSRMYHAGLALHDIGNTIGVVAAFERGGVYDDASKFIGYWNTELPLTSAGPDVVVSTYQRGNRASALIVNTGKEAHIAELRLDPARLGWAGVDAATIKVIDIDEYAPPGGEDPTRMKQPDVKSTADAMASGGSNSGGGVKDKTTEMFDDFDKQVKEEAALKGQFRYDDKNFQQQGDRLLLRVRPRDYRLIELKKP